MAEEKDDTIDSCNDCECHDEEPCYDGSGDDNDVQLKFYRSQACSPINTQIPPNSVVPGVAANPYRTSLYFCNIGTTILLLRSHGTSNDPTVASATAILKVLKANEEWVPDCKCLRRMIQGFICVVNTDTTLTGAISILETLAKPDTEPQISGGRFGQL